MIEIVQGDLLSADTDAVVNTVNCVGVMGRGIALQMKNAYPVNFTAYAAACRHGEVQPGRMLVVETDQLSNPRYIINFPTKRHWRDESLLADIESGLSALIAEVRRLRLSSLALPALGCGLGGLDWHDVRPRIESAFADFRDVRVLLFGPAGEPFDGALPKPNTLPNMTPIQA